MNQLHIIFEPADQHLKEIDRFLTSEKRATGNSFRDNFRFFIAKPIVRNIVVLLSGKQTIGFAAWSEAESQIDLSMFWIEKNNRGKGSGKFLLNSLVQKFVKEDKTLIKLECDPPESEYYWRLNQFIDYPFHRSFNTNLFRTIIPVEKETSYSDKGEYLALWHAEPSSANSKNISVKKSYWEIKRGSDSHLIRPIVQPCKQDWLIEWANNGKILASQKVKYFNNGDSYDGFNLLKIDRLPKP